MTQYLLAIDQGTTNSRAIVFNREGLLINQHEISLNQSYPADGWVEQDPEEMVANIITCCREVLKKASLTATDIAAIGISNQRETTIIWDRHSGKPVYPAIVWQDRRTADFCKKLAAQPIATHIQEKTGLLLDPYFSASKIVWILEQVAGVREKALNGELLFGTVDTYLIWKLTGGKSHVTDATNASRTMLFNIHTQEWDQEILSVLNIPKNILPTVLDCSANFGEIEENILGKKIMIAGVAGDQQAATVGQACFHAGMIKTTYGTGCFMLLNTGEKIIYSKNKLLSTIAYRLNGKVTYGLEGSIFSAGVTIKWLRDNLSLIQTAAETEILARSVKNTGNVYLVPAFTGLGAPYWQPNARGALVGLTRDTGIAHIARAALEAVAYQTKDLLIAMQADSHDAIDKLCVDGGMVQNNWLLQFLADILRIEVQRPQCIESSALGAAYLAGLQVGIYQSLDEILYARKVSATFSPQMPLEQVEKYYAGWKRAVVSIEASSII